MGNLALSFEESKKKYQSELTGMTAARNASLNAMAMPLAAVESSEAVAAVADTASETFKTSYKYLWYETYKDDKYSIIDEQKNIKLDDSQINITQEQNSQYIPFQLPRYFDGVDLMDMMFQIRYVNKNKKENYATPINVTYSDSHIRFGW